MNTIPTAKRLAGLLVLSLAALSLSSCGDDTAPQGATIVAPGDLTVTYGSQIVAGTDATASPLAFQVIDANGNPLPGVRIRFFAGGSVFQLTDRQGNVLNAADQWLFETTTNDQGLSPQDVYAWWSVPACNQTEDVNVNGSVTASVGVASAQWTVDITSESSAACP